MSPVTDGLALPGYRIIRFERNTLMRICAETLMQSYPRMSVAEWLQGLLLDLVDVDQDVAGGAGGAFFPQHAANQPAPTSAMSNRQFMRAQDACAGAGFQ